MSVFVIAEIGSVHDGSLGNARRLVDVAAECGVDAVKFQAHIPDAETLLDAPMPPYFKGEPRFEYFERTAFSLEQWKVLRAHCSDMGVEFLASPFSVEAVDLLEKVEVKSYKVPSGEVTNLPYLDVIGQTGKPVLLSSGMSSWPELDAAVNTLTRHHGDITVLQCTSEYPCPYERVGLNVMLEMRERYNLPVGFSDHTLTNYAAYAAVVLGASVIEKHFTLSRHMYGSDAKHSLEPEELEDLVKGVRAIETTLKEKVDKNEISQFEKMKEIFEKSVVAVVDIEPGSEINPEMLGCKKPGTGISAARLEEVVGNKAAHFIRADTILQESDIS